MTRRPVLLQLILGKSIPLLMFISLFALAIALAHAQDQSGFINIDCGLPPESGDYDDVSTGISYTRDESYIDTGVNQNIAKDYLTGGSHPRHLWTLRSFPQGARNCYNLAVMESKGKKLLIRATFMYGDYDALNRTTIKFDLHLGVELWDTVTLESSTSVVVKEIIHIPSSNYLYVCLVNTGAGTPFISTLELRPLQQDTYLTDNPADSLANFLRWNYAPADPNKVIRYPDDIHDRLWQPLAPADSMSGLNTTLSVIVDNGYNPPVAVMQTAITLEDPNASTLMFSWSSSDPNLQFYIYMHFAEVAELKSGEYRAFYIYLKDQRWFDELSVPYYLWLNTIYGTTKDYKVYNYSLVKTQNSTLPPIINALEVYSVKRFSLSQTDENDVEAILKIKSTYGVNRSDWQGDPCLPKDYMWGGLDCNIVSDNTSPRIKSLNLSSSGLNGGVSFYLPNLNFLENLDLSNNNLTGQIPDFLAEMPQLKFLNLSGNRFSGPVPQKLLDKANSGLKLSFDRAESADNGTQHCEGNQCKGKKLNQLVISLVVFLTASLVIVAALIVTLKLRMRKAKTFEKLGKSKNKDVLLEQKTLQFTYSDILKMTNNFERVLGKGSFGTVYHGLTADATQVAVKLLSPSSSQGYHEFQTEAELLARVHHRNLTYLVGYCYEGTHMALVYEYMANGNLRKHLSANDCNVLSWLKRLHISLDAAQGLDYLHNGCRPPIIHRDIKTTNILLSENFDAKLADFGLSRAFTINDGSFVSTKVVGTPGYLDPEYYETERLHEKSDIYSFGIVILELITGRPAISGPFEDNRHIVHWISYQLAAGDIASIVDPKLKGIYDANSVLKALDVGMACASPTSSERPTMAQVLAYLKECLVAEKVRLEGQVTDAANDFLQVNHNVLETEVRPR